MTPTFHTQHELALAKVYLTRAEALEKDAVVLRQRRLEGAAVPVGEDSGAEIEIRAVFCEVLAAEYRKLAAALGEQ